MDTFRYELLAWIKLSAQEEKTASHWYRGAGWYMNGRDGSGTVTSCQLIAADEWGSGVGSVEALNACGREGWDVAAFVAEPRPDPAPESSLAGVLSGAVSELIIRGLAGDVSPPGAYFILKRRLTTEPILPGVVASTEDPRRT